MKCTCGKESIYKMELQQYYTLDNSLLNTVEMYFCETCLTIEKEADMKYGADLITNGRNNIFAKIVKYKKRVKV